jgi:hypothetical protein
MPTLTLLGGILCLLLKGEREIMPTHRSKTLSLLRSRYKNPPIHSPCDLCRFGLR